MALLLQLEFAEMPLAINQPVRIRYIFQLT